RRTLPLGGELKEDYVFNEGAADLDDRSAASSVRFSELFASGRDTLVLYNFMFSPKMERPCPMCSSFIDGLNGNARHLNQRTSLAIVAKSPIERIREFARVRGWRALRLLSSEKNTYNRDYFGEDSGGDQNPLLTVFVRRDGRIHQFWTSEMQFLP